MVNDLLNKQEDTQQDLNLEVIKNIKEGGGGEELERWMKKLNRKIESYKTGNISKGDYDKFSDFVEKLDDKQISYLKKTLQDPKSENYKKLSPMFLWMRKYWIGKGKEVTSKVKDVYSSLLKSRSTKQAEEIYEQFREYENLLSHNPTDGATGAPILSFVEKIRSLQEKIPELKNALENRIGNNAPFQLIENNFGSVIIPDYTQPLIVNTDNDETLKEIFTGPNNGKINIDLKKQELALDVKNIVSHTPIPEESHKILEGLDISSYEKSKELGIESNEQYFKRGFQKVLTKFSKEQIFSLQKRAKYVCGDPTIIISGEGSDNPDRLYLYLLRNVFSTRKSVIEKWEKDAEKNPGLAQKYELSIDNLFRLEADEKGQITTGGFDKLPIDQQNQVIKEFMNTYKYVSEKGRYFENILGNEEINSLWNTCVKYESIKAKAKAGNIVDVDEVLKKDENSSSALTIEQMLLDAKKESTNAKNSIISRVKMDVVENENKIIKLYDFLVESIEEEKDPAKKLENCKSLYKVINNITVSSKLSGYKKSGFVVLGEYMLEEEINIYCGSDSQRILAIKDSGENKKADDRDVKTFEVGEGIKGVSLPIIPGEINTIEGSKQLVFWAVSNYRHKFDARLSLNMDKDDIIKYSNHNITNTFNTLDKNGLDVLAFALKCYRESLNIVEELLWKKQLTNKKDANLSLDMAKKKLEVYTRAINELGMVEEYKDIDVRLAREQKVFAELQEITNKKNYGDISGKKQYDEDKLSYENFDKKLKKIKIETGLEERPYYTKDEIERDIMPEIKELTGKYNLFLLESKAKKIAIERNEQVPLSSSGFSGEDLWKISVYEGILEKYQNEYNTIVAQTDMSGINNYMQFQAEQQKTILSAYGSMESFLSSLEISFSYKSDLSKKIVDVAGQEDLDISEVILQKDPSKFIEKIIHQANLYSNYRKELEQKQIFNHEDKLSSALHKMLDPSYVQTPFHFTNQVRQETLEKQKNIDKHWQNLRNFSPTLYQDANFLANFWNGAVEGIVGTGSSLGIFLFGVANWLEELGIVDALKLFGPLGFVIDNLLVKNPHQMKEALKRKDKFDAFLKVGTSTSMQEGLIAPDGSINITLDNTISNLGNGIAQMLILLQGGSGIAKSMTPVGKQASKMASRIGLTSSAMMQTLGRNYISGIQNGLSNGQAIFFAVLQSSVSSSLEMISPNTLMTGEFVKKFTEKGAKMTFMVFLKEQVKEVLEEVGQENVQGLSETMINVWFNGKFKSGFKGEYSPEDFITTSYITALITLTYGSASQVLQSNQVEQGDSKKEIEAFIESLGLNKNDKTTKERIANLANKLNAMTNKDAILKLMEEAGVFDPKKINTIRELMKTKISDNFIAKENNEAEKPQKNDRKFIKTQEARVALNPKMQDKIGFVSPEGILYINKLQRDKLDLEGKRGFVVHERMHQSLLTWASKNQEAFNSLKEEIKNNPKYETMKSWVEGSAKMEENDLINEIIARNAEYIYMVGRDNGRSIDHLVHNDLQQLLLSGQYDFYNKNFNDVRDDVVMFQNEQMDEYGLDQVFQAAAYGKYGTRKEHNLSMIQSALKLDGAKYVKFLEWVERYDSDHDVRKNGVAKSIAEISFFWGFFMNGGGEVFIENENFTQEMFNAICDLAIEYNNKKQSYTDYLGRFMLNGTTIAGFNTISSEGQKGIGANEMHPMLLKAIKTNFSYSPKIGIYADAADSFRVSLKTKKGVLVQDGQGGVFYIKLDQDMPSTMSLQDESIGHVSDYQYFFLNKFKCSMVELGGNYDKGIAVFKEYLESLPDGGIKKSKTVFGMRYGKAGLSKANMELSQKIYEKHKDYFSFSLDNNVVTMQFVEKINFMPGSLAYRAKGSHPNQVKAQKILQSVIEDFRTIFGKVKEKVSYTDVEQRFLTETRQEKSKQSKGMVDYIFLLGQNILNDIQNLTDSNDVLLGGEGNLSFLKDLFSLENFYGGETKILQQIKNLVQSFENNYNDINFQKGDFVEQYTDLLKNLLKKYKNEEHSPFFHVLSDKTVDKKGLLNDKMYYSSGKNIENMSPSELKQNRVGYDLIIDAQEEFAFSARPDLVINAYMKILKKGGKAKIALGQDKIAALGKEMSLGDWLVKKIGDAATIEKSELQQQYLVITNNWLDNTPVVPEIHLTGHTKGTPPTRIFREKVPTDFETNIADQKNEAISYCEQKIAEGVKVQEYKKILHNIQNKDFSAWISTISIKQVVENSMKDFDQWKDVVIEISSRFSISDLNDADIVFLRSVHEKNSGDGLFAASFDNIRKKVTAYTSLVHRKLQPLKDALTLEQKQVTDDKDVTKEELESIEKKQKQLYEQEAKYDELLRELMDQGYFSRIDIFSKEEQQHIDAEMSVFTSSIGKMELLVRELYRKLDATDDNGNVNFETNVSAITTLFRELEYSRDRMRGINSDYYDYLNGYHHEIGHFINALNFFIEDQSKSEILESLTGFFTSQFGQTVSGRLKGLADRLKKGKECMEEQKIGVYYDYTSDDIKNILAETNSHPNIRQNRTDAFKLLENKPGNRDDKSTLNEDDFINFNALELGLLLNEMTRNAKKYGPPSSLKGGVEIREDKLCIWVVNNKEKQKGISSTGKGTGLMDKIIENYNRKNPDKKIALIYQVDGKEVTVDQMKSAPKNSNVKVELQIAIDSYKEFSVIKKPGDKLWATSEMQDWTSPLSGVYSFIESYNTYKQESSKQNVLKVLKDGIKSFESRSKIEDINDIENVTPDEKNYIQNINIWAENFNARYTLEKLNTITDEELSEIGEEFEVVIERVKIAGEKLPLQLYLENKKSDRINNQEIGVFRGRIEGSISDALNELYVIPQALDIWTSYKKNPNQQYSSQAGAQRQRLLRIISLGLKNYQDHHGIKKEAIDNLKGITQQQKSQIQQINSRIENFNIKYQLKGKGWEKMTNEQIDALLPSMTDQEIEAIVAESNLVIDRSRNRKEDETMALQDYLLLMASPEQVATKMDTIEGELQQFRKDYKDVIPSTKRQRLEYLHKEMVGIKKSIQNQKNYSINKEWKEIDTKDLLEAADITISMIEKLILEQKLSYEAIYNVELKNFDENYADYDFETKSLWLQKLYTDAVNMEKNIEETGKELGVIKELQRRIEVKALTIDPWRRAGIVPKLYQESLKEATRGSNDAIKDEAFNREIFEMGFLALEGRLEKFEVENTLDAKGNIVKRTYSFQGDQKMIMIDVKFGYAAKEAILMISHTAKDGDFSPIIEELLEDRSDNFDRMYHDNRDPSLSHIKNDIDPDVFWKVLGKTKEAGDILDHRPISGDIMVIHAFSKEELAKNEQEMLDLQEQDDQDSEVNENDTQEEYVEQKNKIKVEIPIVKRYLKKSLFKSKEEKKEIFSRLQENMKSKGDLDFGLLALDEDDVEKFFGEFSGSEIDITRKGSETMNIDISNEKGKRLFSIVIVLSDINRPKKNTRTNRLTLSSDGIYFELPEGSKIDAHRLEMQVLKFALKSKYKVNSRDKNLYDKDMESLERLLSTASPDEEKQILRTLLSKESFPLYTEQEIGETISPLHPEKMDNPSISTIVENSELSQEKRFDKLNDVVSLMLWETPSPKELEFFVQELRNVHDSHPTPVFLKGPKEIETMGYDIRSLAKKYKMEFNPDQIGYFIRSGLLGGNKFSPLGAVSKEALNTKTLDNEDLSHFVDHYVINMKEGAYAGFEIATVDGDTNGQVIYRQTDKGLLCFYTTKNQHSDNDMYCIGKGTKTEDGTVKIEKHITWSAAKDINLKCKKIEIAEIIKSLTRALNTNPKYIHTNVNFNTLLHNEAGLRNPEQYKKIISKNFFDQKERGAINIVNKETGQIQIPTEIAIGFYNKYSSIKGNTDQIKYNTFISKFKTELEGRFKNNLEANRVKEFSNPENGTLYKMGQSENGDFVFVRFFNNQVEIKKAKDRDQSSWEVMTMDHVVEVDRNLDKNTKNQHMAVQRSMDLSNMAFIPESLHKAKNIVIEEYRKTHGDEKPELQQTISLAVKLINHGSNPNGRSDAIINDKLDYVANETDGTQKQQENSTDPDNTQNDIPKTTTTTNLDIESDKESSQDNTPDIKTNMAQLNDLYMAYTAKERLEELGIDLSNFDMDGVFSLPKFSEGILMATNSTVKGHLNTASKVDVKNGKPGFEYFQKGKQLYIKVGDIYHEVGEDGVNMAGLNNYTRGQFKEKIRILQDSGFNQKQRTVLIAEGYCGFDKKEVPQNEAIIPNKIFKKIERLTTKEGDALSQKNLLSMFGGIHIIKRAMGNNIKFSIQENTNSYSVSIAGNDGAHFDITLRFDSEHKISQFGVDEVELPGGFQGFGWAREMIISQMSALGNLGIEKIVGRANKGIGYNGYYVWLRLGFLPSEPTETNKNNSNMYKSLKYKLSSGNMYFLTNNNNFLSLEDKKKLAPNEDIVPGYEKIKISKNSNEAVTISGKIYTSKELYSMLDGIAQQSKSLRQFLSNPFWETDIGKEIWFYSGEGFDFDTSPGEVLENLKKTEKNRNIITEDVKKSIKGLQSFDGKTSLTGKHVLDLFGGEDLISDTFGADVKISVERNHGDKRITFDLESAVGDLFSYSLFFDQTGSIKMAKMDKIELIQDRQGDGRARKMTKIQMQAFADLGVGKVIGRATKRDGYNGHYVWMRMGYMPTPSPENDALFYKFLDQFHNGNVSFLRKDGNFLTVEQKKYLSNNSSEKGSYTEIISSTTDEIVTVEGKEYKVSEYMNTLIKNTEANFNNASFTTFLSDPFWKTDIGKEIWFYSGVSYDFSVNPKEVLENIAIQESSNVMKQINIRIRSAEGEKISQGYQVQENSFQFLQEIKLGEKTVGVDEEVSDKINTYFQNNDAEKQSQQECHDFVHRVYGIEKTDWTDANNWDSEYTRTKLEFDNLEKKSLLSGDVTLFTDVQGKALHSAIYLGDGLYLSKMGKSGGIFINTSKEINQLYPFEKVTVYEKIDKVLSTKQTIATLLSQGKLDKGQVDYLNNVLSNPEGMAVSSDGTTWLQTIENSIEIGERTTKMLLDLNNNEKLKTLGIVGLDDTRLPIELINKIHKSGLPLFQKGRENSDQARQLVKELISEKYNYTKEQALVITRVLFEHGRCGKIAKNVFQSDVDRNSIRDYVHRREEMIEKNKQDIITQEEVDKLFGKGKFGRETIEQGNELGYCYRFAPNALIQQVNGFSDLIRLSMKKVDAEGNNREVRLPLDDPHGMIIKVSMDEVNKMYEHTDFGGNYEKFKSVAGKSSLGMQLLELATIKYQIINAKNDSQMVARMIPWNFLNTSIDLEQVKEDYKKKGDIEVTGAMIKFLGRGGNPGEYTKSIIRNSENEIINLTDYTKDQKKVFTNKVMKFVSSGNKVFLSRMESQPKISSQISGVNKTTPLGESIDIYTNHVYAIEQISQKGGVTYFVVINPDNTGDKIYLTEEQLTESFNEFDLVKINYNKMFLANSDETTTSPLSIDNFFEKYNITDIEQKKLSVVAALALNRMIDMGNLSAEGLATILKNLQSRYPDGMTTANMADLQEISQIANDLKIAESKESESEYGKARIAKAHELLTKKFGQNYDRLLKDKKDMTVDELIKRGGILLAYEVGEGKSIFEYTDGEMREKARILWESGRRGDEGQKGEELKLLINQGICGDTAGIIMVIGASGLLTMASLLRANNMDGGGYIDQFKDYLKQIKNDKRLKTSEGQEFLKQEEERVKNERDKLIREEQERKDSFGKIKRDLDEKLKNISEDAKKYAEEQEIVRERFRQYRKFREEQRKKQNAGRENTQEKTQEISPDKLKEAYSILGVDETISDKDLRTARGNLMKETHPDVVQAKGIAIEEATKKTQEINAAYDLIKKSRIGKPKEGETGSGEVNEEAEIEKTILELNVVNNVDIGIENTSNAGRLRHLNNLKDVNAEQINTLVQKSKANGRTEETRTQYMTILGLNSEQIKIANATHEKNNIEYRLKELIMQGKVSVVGEKILLDGQEVPANRSYVENSTIEEVKDLIAEVKEIGTTIDADRAWLLVADRVCGKENNRSWLNTATKEEIKQFVIDKGWYGKSGVWMKSEEGQKQGASAFYSTLITKPIRKISSIEEKNDVFGVDNKNDRSWLNTATKEDIKQFIIDQGWYGKGAYRIQNKGGKEIGGSVFYMALVRSEIRKILSIEEKNDVFGVDNKNRSWLNTATKEEIKQFVIDQGWYGKGTSRMQKAEEGQKQGASAFYLALVQRPSIRKALTLEDKDYIFGTNNKDKNDRSWLNTATKEEIKQFVIDQGWYGKSNAWMRTKEGKKEGASAFYATLIVKPIRKALSIEDKNDIFGVDNKNRSWLNTATKEEINQFVIDQGWYGKSNAWMRTKEGKKEGASAFYMALVQRPSIRKALTLEDKDYIFGTNNKDKNDRSWLNTATKEEIKQFVIDQGWYGKGTSRMQKAEEGKKEGASAFYQALQKNKLLGRLSIEEKIELFGIYDGVEFDGNENIELNYNFSGIRSLGTVEALLILMEPEKYMDQTLLSNTLKKYSQKTYESIKRTPSENTIANENDNGTSQEISNPDDISEEAKTVHKVLEGFFAKVTGKAITDDQRYQVKSILSQLAYKELGSNYTAQSVISYFARQMKSTKNVAMRNLYEELQKEVSDFASYQIPNIKTPLQLYQKEFIHRAVQQDVNINADEPGLGKTLQTIATFELLYDRKQAKNCVIVSPSKVKAQRSQEILKHTNNNEKNILVVDQNTTVDELQQGKYILVHYDLLKTLKNKNSEVFERLKTNTSLLVLDEMQKVDNQETQLFKAVSEIKPEKKIGLSATLVQNDRGKLANIINLLNLELPGITLPISKDAVRKLLNEGDPKQRKIFRDLLFDKYITRRHKEDVLQTLPELHESVSDYQFSDEQQKLSDQILHDFPGFLAKYKNIIKDFDNIEGIKGLQQYYYLQMVAVLPELFGLPESQLFTQLDQTIKEKMAKGEKVVLVCRHTAVIDKLMERYKESKPLRFDGKTPSDIAESNRVAFQESTGPGLLIINAKSGGEGINLGAASTLINVELPSVFTQYYQTINRVSRMDSENTSIDVINMVGKQSNGAPTINQSILDLLQSRAYMFDLIMRGYVTDKEATDVTMGGILSYLRDNKALPETEIKPDDKYENMDPESKQEIMTFLQKQHPSEAMAAKTLKAFAKLQKDGVVDLMSLVRENKNFDFNLLIENILSGTIKDREIRYMTAALEEPSKWNGYRYIDTMIKANFENVGIYDQMSQAYNKIPKHIVMAIYTCFPEHYQDILQLANTIPTRNNIFDISASLIAPNGYNVYIARMLSENKIFLEEWKADATGREMFKNRFKQMNILKQQNNDLYNQLVATKFVSYKDFEKSLQDNRYLIVEKLINTKFHEITKEQINQTLDQRGGDLPSLFQFAKKYKQAYPEEYGKLMWCFAQDCKGSFREYKYMKNNDKDTFVPNVNEKQFFGVRRNNISMPLGEKTITPKSKERLFTGEIDQVSAFLGSGGLIETDPNFQGDLLNNLPSLSSSQLIDEINKVNSELKSRGESYYKTGALAKQETKEDFEKKQTALRNVKERLQLYQAMVSMKNGISDAEKVEKAQICKSILEKKMALVQDMKLREGLENAKQYFEEFALAENYKDLTIEEVDDMKLVLNIGNLFPEKKNCFNPENGLDKEGSTVIDKVANRYKKMLVIKSSRGYELTTTLNISKSVDGKKLYLLIDTPFVRGSYNFKDELIKFGQAKIKEFKAQGIDIELCVGKNLLNDQENKKYATIENKGFTGKTTYEYLDTAIIIGYGYQANGTKNTHKLVTDYIPENGESSNIPPETLPETETGGLGNLDPNGD